MKTFFIYPSANEREQKNISFVFIATEFYRYKEKYPNIKLLFSDRKENECTSEEFAECLYLMGQSLVAGEL